MSPFELPSLEILTTLLVFQYLLLFCRIGSAIMLIPGIGEIFVPPNIRLLLALFITLVLYLPLKETLPPVPGSPLELGTLVLAEVLTGLFIGAMTRLLMGVMHMAGMFIALQSSLASALFFDPNQGTQGTVIGTFLTMTAIAFIFATNTHHLLLAGIAGSYVKFPVGEFPPVGDFSNFAARLLSEGFKTALMISAPVLVLTFFMYLAAGIMSRLMPTMQVFFIMMPIQILASFFVMMLTISATLLWYVRYFQDTVAELLG